jgi:hypothetical protein
VWDLQNIGDLYGRWWLGDRRREGRRRKMRGKVERGKIKVKMDVVWVFFLG